MMQRWTASRWLIGAGLLLVCVALGRGVCDAEQPSQAAVAGFDRYAEGLEARLAVQRREGKDLVDAQAETRLRRGELVIENLTPGRSASRERASTTGRAQHLSRAQRLPISSG